MDIHKRTLGVLHPSHPLTPFSKKGLTSVSVLLLSVLIATLVIHYLEGWSIVDSFYYISMITTTQGPTSTPSTFAGKVFASVYAYYSVGLLVTTVVFSFGPLLGYTFRRGTKFFEFEESRFAAELHRPRNPAVGTKTEPRE